MMGRIGNPHVIDDGIDSTRGRAGRSQIRQVRIEDLGVFEVAEGLLEFGPRAPHYAEVDATPLEFGSHRGANGAGRAEDCSFLNEGSHLRSPSIDRKSTRLNSS